MSDDLDFAWNVYRKRGPVETRGAEAQPIYLRAPLGRECESWEIAGVENLEPWYDLDCCTWVCLFPSLEAASFFCRGIEAALGDTDVSYEIASEPTDALPGGPVRCLIFWHDSDPELCFRNFLRGEA